MALLLHAKFDNRKTPVIDSVGTYTLSDIGSPTYNQPGIASWGGKSCQLLGNDRITLDTALEIPANGDMSATVWVQSDGSDVQSFICGNSFGTDGLGILIGATQEVEARFNSVLSYGNAPSLVVDTPHHIAVTRDGTTGVIKIYVDGVSVGDSTTSTANWFIEHLGGGSLVSADLNGFIQDLRIYNHVIGQSEIKRIRDNVDGNQELGKMTYSIGGIDKDSSKTLYTNLNKPLNTSRN